jgi:outer membrane protein, heavy metal efflux system
LPFLDTMNRSSLSTLIAATLLASGCASLPPERGYAGSAALVAERSGLAPAFAAEPAAPAAIPDQPLTVADAQALALQRSPRLELALAEIGFARAEVDAARRIGNPHLGLSRLREDAGTERVVSLSLGITDALLLPWRKRQADGELARVEQAVAAEVLELLVAVEKAWYRAVAAAQVAQMRELSARAAEQSAALAQRFFDAGNIHRLQLAQEQANASHARILALRAEGAALAARGKLALLLGVADRDWRLPERLPAPVAVSADAAAVRDAARRQRLDLAAAEAALQLAEGDLAQARRWRGIGEIELEAERERSAEGERKRGRGIGIEIPLFDQGQARIAEAEAALRAARAERDALQLALEQDVALSIDRLARTASVAERYRNALLPQRETVVRETQARVDYMLMGVFELIAVRREEFEGYEDYLAAVRDFWLAVAELRHAAGGRWPGEPQPGEPSLGADAVLPKPGAADPHAGHGGHGSHGSHAEHGEQAGHPGHEGHHGHDTHQGHHGDHKTAPASRDDDAPANDDSAPEDDSAHSHHQHGDTP